MIKNTSNLLESNITEPQKSNSDTNFNYDKVLKIQATMFNQQNTNYTIEKIVIFSKGTPKLIDSKI